MECPNCGGELLIEDAYCSHCGTPNAYFRQHREDMAAYNQQYVNTKDTVMHKTSRFTGITIKLSIICALVIANVGVFVCIGASGSVIDYFKEKELIRNYDEYSSQLDTFEKEGDYASFAEFYRTKKLYFVQEYSHYDTVYDLSNVYQNIMEQIIQLKVEGDRYDSGEMEYYKEIAQLIARFTKYSTFDEFDDPKEYTGIHKQSIDGMKEEIIVALNYYMGLDKEVARTLFTMEEVDILLVLVNGGNTNE